MDPFPSDIEESYLEAEPTDEDPGFLPSRRPWRRRGMVALAVVVAVSLAILPIQSLFDGTSPPFAESGLEICGNDYCIVVDAVSRTGLDLEMSRLANTLLDDASAAALVDELTAYLGVDDISLTMVDELGGRLGGVYDPAARSIVIERPANAWVVAHEVAHTVAAGHGAEFQEVLIDLTRRLAEG